MPTRPTTRPRSGPACCSRHAAQPRESAAPAALFPGACCSGRDGRPSIRHRLLPQRATGVFAPAGIIGGLSRGHAPRDARKDRHSVPEISRASSRERVCQYVKILVVAVSCKNITQESFTLTLPILTNTVNETYL